MSHHLAPRRGRCTLFVDPSLIALDAHHIWLPPAGRLSLSAVAEPARASDDAVFVPKLNGVKHILVDPSGRQHVLLRANGGVLQIEIEGADITAGAVRLTFFVRGLRGLGRIGANFSDLRRILSPRHPQATGEPHWTTRTRNLRDGFLTFDCHATGAPDEQQAAILIYGRKITLIDWPTAPFRERMRRNRKRGENLVAGGYRKLLE